MRKVERYKRSYNAHGPLEKQIKEKDSEEGALRSILLAKIISFCSHNAVIKMDLSVVHILRLLTHLTGLAS